MQNDSFKMRQHYAPYNRSEESHDLSEKYILRTFSVGYFAFAQYDEKEERSHSVKSNRSCRGRFFYAKNRRYANFI